MKIALISFEVYPFAKVGGLADVAGSLPKYLNKLGEDVFVVMPYHKKIKDNADKFGIKLVRDDIVLDKVQGSPKVGVYKTKLPQTDIDVYFIGSSEYFNTEKIYPGEELESKNAIVFSNAVFEMMKTLNLEVDLIHSNDWQSGLVSVYLKAMYEHEQIFKNVATVYTIHNLGYQGVFPPDLLEFSGLHWDLFTMDRLEFYGKLNFMKGGIIFSDITNTVSATYAKEIQTKEFGNKLEGVLSEKAKSGKLFGIVNGIDYEEFNSLTDKRITNNFKIESVDDEKGFENKYINKLALQKEFNLDSGKDKLLTGVISRLFVQKGVDLLVKAMESALEFAPDIQLIVLGTGDKEYENKLEELGKKYPGRVSINLKFDINMAQRIYSGLDIFLMPSRYEPCGLGQLIAMRYATVPIVRFTGGLADTVKEYNSNTKEGNGFGFSKYDSKDFMDAISRALDLFRNNKMHWNQVVYNAYTTDSSWEKSAKEYEKIYKKAIEDHRR
jgi:starch synthase